MSPIDTTQPILSKHRIEALTDGIFAVAMTLLVMDLHLPDHADVTSQGALVAAVTHLFPKFVSWLISFLILASFWISNHRMFSYVRHVDTALLWITMLTLASASLLPFAAALLQHVGFFSQIIYSCDLILMAMGSLWSARYIYRHPSLCGGNPIPESVGRRVRFGTISLIVVAIAAIGISYWAPGKSNMAFFLLLVISRFGPKMAEKSAPAIASPPPVAAAPANQASIAR